MWKSSLYKRPNFWCDDDAVLIKLAERQYEVYNQRTNDEEVNVESAIPKLLHFIWLGSSLPVKYERVIDSWRVRHPGWDIILWDDDKATSFELKNATHFEQASNFGMKSDILRYEVLNDYGGVYVDIDYECVRNIDDVVQQCSFFAGFSHTEVLEVNNGLIGCAPHHPVAHLLIKNISMQVQAKAVLNNDDLAASIGMFLGGETLFGNRQTVASSASDTIAQTGPGLLTRVLSEYLQGGEKMPEIHRLVLFPVDVYHPVPNNVHISLSDTDGNDEIVTLKERYVSHRTRAIHWWQCSWQ